MKKIFAVILTLALLSMATVTAFADNIDTIGESGSAEVKGTYAAGGSSATVYSVDITWGSMEFTYTDATAGTWNPAVHKYDGAEEAKWSCAAGADKIEVTNHSNADVTVNFSYASEDAYNGIIGTFSDNSQMKLDSAENTEFSNAPSGSVTLGLEGALYSGATQNTKIGTVTVTLAN